MAGKGGGGTDVGGFRESSAVRLCSTQSPSLKPIDFVWALGLKNGLFPVLPCLPEFLDRVRSSAIREELGVAPLLLRVEEPDEVAWASSQDARWTPLWRPPGRPRTRWRDYVSRLVWERLGIPPDELEEVAGEREVWASLLRLMPPRPDSG
ncbi:hypothetical protein D4764_12G0010910 [Takifugu flavidus]|uniref:Uncharacterized protein n=1 Tax=Takifugu flavidus TaxID=433684 RepID=A0A5C6PFY8_9TELE|nr:hypothetical protein D4764_12G0010910 [Takifugu flavidus]